MAKLVKKLFLFDKIMINISLQKFRNGELQNSNYFVKNYEQNIQIVKASFYSAFLLEIDKV